MSRTARRIKRSRAISEHKNAVALLKADRREVEAFFKEFKMTESSTHKLKLARNICAALTVHTTIEEEIFYPAFLAATGATDLYDEAQVEHDDAKKLIAEIESSKPGDPRFDARITVLSEMIKHHVKEEEMFGEMFSKARRVAGTPGSRVGVWWLARRLECLTTHPRAPRYLDAQRFPRIDNHPVKHTQIDNLAYKARRYASGDWSA